MLFGEILAETSNFTEYEGEIKITVLVILTGKANAPDLRKVQHFSSTLVADKEVRLISSLPLLPTLKSVVC